MRTRILLVLLLIGCLGAAAMIFRGQEPEKATQATIAQRDHAHKLHAQEADAETKAQIARRDEIGEQAMAAANAGAGAWACISPIMVWRSAGFMKGTSQRRVYIISSGGIEATSAP